MYDYITFPGNANISDTYLINTGLYLRVTQRTGGRGAPRHSLSPFLPLQKRSSHAGEPGNKGKTRKGSANAGQVSVQQPIIGIRVLIGKAVILAILRGKAVARDGQGQVGTVGEGILPDGGDAVRNRDSGEGVAVGERIIADGGNALRDRDSGERFAVVERLITDGGDA